MRKLTPIIKPRLVLTSQCNDQRMDPVNYTPRRIHRADCKYETQRRCATWRLRRPGFMYTSILPFTILRTKPLDLCVVMIPICVLICQTSLRLSSVCWLELGHIAAKTGLARSAELARLSVSWKSVEIVWNLKMQR